jgi:hypothetical protein
MITGNNNEDTDSECYRNAINVKGADDVDEMISWRMARQQFETSLHSSVGIRSETGNTHWIVLRSSRYELRNVLQKIARVQH